VKSFRWLCQFLFLSLLGLSSCYLEASVKDTHYPNRSIRLLVGFTPGGTSDVVARIVGKKLGEAWGQSFVIDNRAGAAGMVAAEITAHAPADGYTLFFVSSSFAMQPSTATKLPYDVKKDFAPITLAVSTPYLLVIHPSVQAHNLKEFIALAKSKPGQISSATAGPGSAIQSTAELFNTVAGVNILLVPYKGAVGITDLIAGHVQTSFAGFAQTSAHIKGGRLRAIAVSSAKRFSLLPDIPSIAEAGVPGFDVTIWYGLVAPAKTPLAIINKLNAGFATTLQSQETQQTLIEIGVDTVASTPQQFASIIDKDIIQWKRLNSINNPSR
jgi:tripartite-type tricarboxylate transporter receptor subunit TctC